MPAYSLELYVEQDYTVVFTNQSNNFNNFKDVSSSI